MNGTLGPYVLQLLGSEEGEGLLLKTDDSRGHTEPQHTGITDGRDEVLPTHLPAVLRPPALRGLYSCRGAAQARRGVLELAIAIALGLLRTRDAPWCHYCPMAALVLFVCVCGGAIYRALGSTACRR